MTKQQHSTNLLTRAQLLARVPLSFPTIWKLMRAGKFPRSHCLDEGKFAKSFWYEHEIEAWMASLPIKRLLGDAPSSTNLGRRRKAGA